MESFCVVLPLFTAERELGGLHLGARRRHAYSQEDIEFMEQAARQVAVAVDNALNYEAAHAYERQLAPVRDRLQALLEISNAVGIVPVRRRSSRIRRTSPRPPVSSDISHSRTAKYTSRLQMSRPLTHAV